MKICPHPIIILGSPRSGTTALAWALAAHSQLWTSEESQLMLDLFGDGRLDKNYLRDGKGRGSWLVQQKVERKDFLRYLGLGLNALFTDRAGGKRWVDHTPPYTLMVRDLADLFPGAQFLHILRDGRRCHALDDQLSQERRRPRGGNAGSVISPARHRGPRFGGACARPGAKYVRSAIEFCSANPTRGVTVVNEEMAGQSPRAVPGRILAFLKASHEAGARLDFRTNKMNSEFFVRGDKRVDDPWDDLDPRATHDLPGRSRGHHGLVRALARPCRKSIP